MIDQNKMEAAMEYLAETDEPYAIAKGDLLKAEILAKRVRARLFVAGEGSVEARKAAAEGHSEAIASDDALISATMITGAEFGQLGPLAMQPSSRILHLTLVIR